MDVQDALVQVIRVIGLGRMTLSGRMDLQQAQTLVDTTAECQGHPTLCLWSLFQ